MWCKEAGMKIIRMNVEESDIAVVAQKSEIFVLNPKFLY